jgi:GNAT superfamily N-acetyltransferase
MGIQDVRDVTLIRHAYVLPVHQGRGIGGALLTFLAEQTTSPLLVGTWAAADWAIRFYDIVSAGLAGREGPTSQYHTGASPRQKETSAVLMYAR